MSLIYTERACLFKANPQSSFHCFPYEDMQGHSVGYYKTNLQYKILFCCVCQLICVILAPSSITATEAKSVYAVFTHVALIHMAFSPCFF